MPPCSSWWCAAAVSAPCWPSNKVACLMNNSIHPSLTTALPTGTVCLRVGSRTLLLHRRAWLITLGLLVALVLLSLLALTLGSGKLTMLGVIQTLLGEGNRLSEVTVFKIRLPRIVAVLVAGAAMGLSGCLVQTLIRNRLATPDMIGVNEGASLAIIAFSLYLTLGSWPWWAAPLGALFAAAVLYALCNKPGEQGYLFVVIGIGVSELMNAIGQFVMSTQSLVHLTSLYLWNMGNFVGQGYSTVLPVGLLILLVCPWIIYLSRALGVLRLGPVTAQSLGVNVNRVQLGVLAQAIVVAALGTAIGGPVVFIAMAAPVLASWLSRDRIVPLWIAALCGALLLLASDTLVRVLASPHEVATGIMTRILGGLLLLFILLKDRQKAD
ncbi:iron chelate uptake ABC transporter family permease subunit [Aeromonas hydrophila]|nr:iron chelate uptake ABC transporter family permease subunit [Aeromonas hydrophila]MBQ4715219.1 iron chelate uptake ABC transporter family permease subunit [Aeromonas hydrophila]UNU34499.1 iron chelate uptake ABC transporter family permease subunit [Aeromonas hydrophila]UNU38718.1 iron chelate uptake ABC transporter family permease subunit [Aeromonas hydrophila]